MEEGA